MKIAHPNRGALFFCGYRITTAAEIAKQKRGRPSHPRFIICPIVCLIIQLEFQRGSQQELRLQPAELSWQQEFPL